MENSKDRIWLVIPVFNNAQTVEDIVNQSFNYIENILVVDDGSTDADLASLLKETNAVVITHEKNKGKGEALSSAIDYLTSTNAQSMITMDADGQHLCSDIPKFIQEIENNPDAIHIGIRNFNQNSIPGSSRFGRKFSNMWIKVETGKGLKDTQSGFRAYPVHLVSQLKLHGTQYDFEIEIITRACWAGIPINEININVVYQPPESRISHFKKIKDNWIISLMHTRLVGRRLVPVPHKQLIKAEKQQTESLLRHPVRFFKMLLRENTTPMELAVSAAVGTFLAVLPIIGFHTIAILYVAARLHLNKIMAVSIQILYSPPFVPFICIEVGHYIRTGTFITQLTFATFKTNWQHYFLDWITGSLILAPIYTVVAYIGVYFIALNIQNKVLKKTHV